MTETNKFKTYDLKILPDGTNFQLQIDADGLEIREVRGLEFESQDIARPFEIYSSIRAALGSELRFQGNLDDIEIESPITETSQIIQYGKDLCRKLLADLESEKLKSFIEINASNDYEIHIRINDEKLSQSGLQIPWEALHLDEAGTQPFAITPQVAISRLLPGNNSFSTSVEIEDSVRILIFSAEPIGEDPVAANQEIRAISKELSDGLGEEFQDNGRSVISLERISRTTRESLRDKLSEFRPHIVHYIGHSNFHENETGVLAFHDSGNPNQKDLISATDFADIFSQNRPVLVVLNSCLSANSGQTPYTGIAKTLIASGIPYVVAMQNFISNKSAITFSTAFYRALENNVPVWQAVSAGRGNIKAQSLPYRLEYITPVLYTQKDPPFLIIPEVIEPPIEDTEIDRNSDTTTSEEDQIPVNWQQSFIKMMGEPGVKNIIGLVVVMEVMLAALANTLFTKFSPYFYVVMILALLGLVIWLLLGSKPLNEERGDGSEPATEGESPRPMLHDDPVLTPQPMRFRTTWKWVLAGLFFLVSAATFALFNYADKIGKKSILREAFLCENDASVSDPALCTDQFVECWNSTQASSPDLCPPQIQCWNASYVTDGALCPPVPTQICPDGSVIPATSTCPPAPVQTQICPDGSVVAVTSTCPPAPVQTQICSDGSVIPVTSTCPPAPIQTQTCSDGSEIPATSTCPSPGLAPPHRCWDGSIVSDPSSCSFAPPSAPSPQFRCWDGGAVPDLSYCPPLEPQLIPTNFCDEEFRQEIVYFEYDRSQSEETSNSIRRILDFGESCRVSHVSLTGHTDSSGAATYNSDLSKRRTKDIRDELILQGIDPLLITSEGRGETDPFVPTGDGVREQLNRRTEIFVTLEPNITNYRERVPEFEVPINPNFENQNEEFNIHPDGDVNTDSEMPQTIVPDDGKVRRTQKYDTELENKVCWSYGSLSDQRPYSEGSVICHKTGGLEDRSEEFSFHICKEHDGLFGWVQVPNKTCIP